MGSPIRATDCASRQSGQRGFTYLMLLLWVAITGAMLAALGTAWSTMAHREREAELLWRGEQIKRALESYEKAGVALQAQPVKTLNSQANSSNLPDRGFDLSNSRLASTARGGGSQGSDNLAANSGTADAASAAQQVLGGPLQLEDLLEDQRSGKLVRHLRRLYTDPITRGPWGVIKGKDGRIKGVYSVSTDQPWRAALGVSQYRDLVFSASGAAVASSAPARVQMAPEISPLGSRTLH